MFDVNAKGVFLCMKHEIKAMRQTGGAIVNNSYETGFRTGGTTQWLPIACTLLLTSYTGTVLLPWLDQPIQLRRDSLGLSGKNHRQVWLAGHINLAMVQRDPVYTGSQQRQCLGRC